VQIAATSDKRPSDDAKIISGPRSSSHSLYERENMVETVQDYIARLTGLVGDRDPATMLAETPGRLRSLVNGATPAELTWTSAPTRWSVTQIVAHLADAEAVGAWRIRSVLAQDGCPLQAYDQNVWASAFRYEATDPAESLTLFETLRLATLRLLKRVDPARLAHAGLHQERGPEPILQIIKMYAGHDLNHLNQIERLLDEARRR
jgi:hypothetical protein